jgi:hypothetical protein
MDGITEQPFVDPQYDENRANIQALGALSIHLEDALMHLGFLLDELAALATDEVCPVCMGTEHTWDCALENARIFWSDFQPPDDGPSLEDLS